MINRTVCVFYGPIPIDGRLPALRMITRAPGVAIVVIIPRAEKFPAGSSQVWEKALYLSASGRLGAIVGGQLCFTFRLPPINPCRNHFIHLSPVFFGDRISVSEMAKRPKPMSPCLL